MFDLAWYTATTMNQARALDILKIGANVFLTGEPGGWRYFFTAYV